MSAHPQPAAAVQARPWVELGVLLAAAAATRLGAAHALGEGAPFGPDGTGAEAAAVLGGHVYPGHPWLIRLSGTARALSLVCGPLACAALWAWGRAVGLGGGGGWLAVFFPFAVYTGALSAGDAPALAVATAGCALATRGASGGVVGGALAGLCVFVKPVALPALALLGATPWGLLGAALTLPLAWSGPLQPLVAPRMGGGLLGSWWVANHDALPADAPAAGRVGEGGVEALAALPAWTGLPLLAAAVLGALWPRRARAAPAAVRAAVVFPVAALLGAAALAGSRLEPRYALAAAWACLPWVGAWLPRGVEALLLWPAAALVTQVAVERANRDPEAVVPRIAPVHSPAFDARALFDEASTDDATRMRRTALEQAATLPQGATVRVSRLPHGREGEFVWPLRLARPDVTVERE
jgi:hypothetical protein